MKTKRNLWPYGIVAAFVLFFAGMATVVVIAATHRDSLVRSDYYEQELKFQSQIDGRARAQKAGASIELSAGKLLVSVPSEQLARKLSGIIEFYRPSSPDLDREIALAPAGNGTQALDVSHFASGLWQVRVKWSAGGEDYFLEQKIKI